MGVKEQSATMIILSILNIIYYWPKACSYAISTLVGTSLGQDNLEQAKKVAFISIVICFVVVLMISFKIVFDTD